MTVLEFLLLWTLIVLVNLGLAYFASSPANSDDPTRLHAYELTVLVGAVSAGLWLLSALVIGCSHLIGRTRDPGDAFLLLLLPIGMWVPVAIVALGFSLVLYLRMRDFRMLAFWAVSAASVLLPFAWLVIQTQS